MKGQGITDGFYRKMMVRLFGLNLETELNCAVFRGIGD